jgi:hypothetical protein
VSDFDLISKPKHYNHGQIQPIRVWEDWGLCPQAYIASAIKYLARWEHKGSPLEDLRKARQYLDFAIDYVERQEKAPTTVR